MELVFVVSVSRLGDVVRGKDIVFRFEISIFKTCTYSHVLVVDLTLSCAHESYFARLIRCVRWFAAGCSYTRGVCSTGEFDSLRSFVDRIGVYHVDEYSEIKLLTVVRR
ncbi:hypothetical protein OROMI_013280 [Orobanche minor]